MNVSPRRTASLICVGCASAFLVRWSDRGQRYCSRHCRNVAGGQSHRGTSRVAGHERAHRIWAQMLGRCRCSSNRSFPNYGGRGISVCERWTTFEHFLSDMGDPPLGTTLERIDNNGAYAPTNCRWASRTEQARNTRSNRLLTHNGRTECLARWAEISGVPAKTIAARLDRYGWALERALTTSVAGSAS